MSKKITTIIFGFAFTLIATPTLAAPSMTKTVIPTPEAGYINTIAAKDNQLFVLGFGSSASYDWQGQTLILTQNHDIDQNTGIAKHFAWGDYDNDGDTDAFLLNYGGKSHLYQNQNGNLIEESTQTLPSISTIGSHAQFVDIDNNGFLDLYISTSFGNNMLFLNSNGIFTQNTTHPLVQKKTNTKKTIFADIDENGTLDAFLINTKPQSHTVYLQSAGTFVEQENHPFALSANTSDAAFFDIDTDGDLDLFLANYNQPSQVFTQTQGTYQQTTLPALSTIQKPIRAITVVDIDNDADSDILLLTDQFEKNILLENTQNGSFVNRTNHALTTDQHQNIHARTIDQNGDGAVDLLVPDKINGTISLYTNQAPTNNWLSLSLHGVQSNRNGIGATVYVHTANNTQPFSITDDNLPIHIGLADSEQVDITVVWPDGTTQEETNIPVNTNYTIEQREPAYEKVGPILFDPINNFTISTSSLSSNSEETITFTIQVENTLEDSIDNIRLTINHQWNQADGITPQESMGLFIGENGNALEKYPVESYKASNIVVHNSTKTYDQTQGITTYQLTIGYIGINEDIRHNLPRVYIWEKDQLPKWYPVDEQDRYDVLAAPTFVKTGPATFDPQEDIQISTSSVSANGLDTMTFTIDIHNTLENSLADVRFLMNYRRWVSEGITPIDVGYFTATPGNPLQKYSETTYGNQFVNVVSTTKTYTPETGRTTYTLTITYAGINEEDILGNIPFVYIHEPEYPNYTGWHRAAESKRFDITVPQEFSKIGAAILDPLTGITVSSSSIPANGEHTLTFDITIQNTLEHSVTDIRLFMNYRRWNSDGITPIDVGYFVANTGEVLHEYSASAYGNNLVEVVSATRAYNSQTGETTLSITVVYNGVSSDILQNLPFVYFNEPGYTFATWHRADEAQRFDILAE